MRKGIFKNAALIVIAIVFLGKSDVPAQTTLSGDHIITGKLNVGVSGSAGGIAVSGETGNTAVAGLTIDGDGGVVFSGSAGAGRIPAEGGGTRFVWYPKKAALRAGRVSGGDWDDVNIGSYSIALGDNTRASALSSFAVGSATMSTGNSAVAFGAYSSALGSYSIAMGMAAQATKNFSVAIGADGYAWGVKSIAIGSTASGTSSTAIGLTNLAVGDYATAIGANTIASGLRSTSLGYKTNAIGDYSVSLGDNTTAGSHTSLAIGRWNVGAGDAGTWRPDDALFEIGNGSSSSARSNALTVFKNGAIRMDRQGDILMGEFGN